MDKLVETLAAGLVLAAIVGVCTLAVKRPFMFVRLMTGMWLACGAISVFGTGMAFGGKFAVGSALGLAGMVGLLGLYVLMKVAEASANEHDRQREQPRNHDNP